MSDSDKKIDPVDTYYDWSMENYGVPPYANMWDKKILIKKEEMIDYVIAKKNSRNISEKDINIYDENKLFPELYIDEGLRGYPIYCVERSLYIYDLIGKWNYSLKTIFTIIDYEEYIIDEILNEDKIDYYDGPDDKYFLMYYKRRIDDATKILKDGKELSFKQRNKYKKELKIDNKVYKFWNNAISNGLTNSQKNILSKTVFKIKNWVDTLNTQMIFSDRAKFYLGFSPQVYIISASFHPSKFEIESSFIKDYKYHINYLDVLNCWFGAWRFPEGNPFKSFINFYSTPEFFIGTDDGKSIDIRIREPNKVTTKFMREIEKLYSHLRNSIGVEKAKWGEKSGAKKTKKERDEFYRSFYKELREKNPRAAAEKQYLKVLEAGEEQFGDIGKVSEETLKRILYTKKKQ